MTTFSDREQGFEKKFAHDAETQFRAAARGNKYLGQWLAEHFGLTGGEAEAYVGSIITADLQEAGHEDVMRKVMADVAERQVALEEAAVRAKLEECHAKAKAEIMDESA